MKETSLVFKAKVNYEPADKIRCNKYWVLITGSYLASCLIKRNILHSSKTYQSIIDGVYGSPSAVLVLSLEMITMITKR